jgi:hypothetical protein
VGSKEPVKEQAKVEQLQPNPPNFPTLSPVFILANQTPVDRLPLTHNQPSLISSIQATLSQSESFLPHQASKPTAAVALAVKST